MKKFISLLLAALIIMSALPVFAQDVQEQGITVYITVSKYGSIVNDTDGNMIAAAPVELAGKTEYTLDDAFISAHDAYYPGGSAAGYASSEGAYGPAVDKLWGDTSGLIGYQVNFGNDTVMGPNHIIKDGDYIDAYIMQSYYPDSEAYTRFDKVSADAFVNSQIELTLSEAGYDENWNTVFFPCQDAVITVNGEETAYKTDSDGKAYITFTQPGEYVISAVKTKDIGAGTVTAICAPVCIANISSAETYNVTVKAAPYTSDVRFYQCLGYDDNGADLLGDEITAQDGGMENNYHVYSLELPAGIYSFRGTNSEGNSIGGMSFAIPGENEDDSGDIEITLRQADIYTTTKYDGTNYATEKEYTAEVSDSSGHFAQAGTPYKSGNYTRFPYLLCAAGSAYPYTVQLIPSPEVAQQYSLGTNTMLNFSVSAGTSIATKSGTLPTLINAAVNAPDGAAVQVFKQVKNYCLEQIDCESSANAGNGTTDYIYRLPQNGSGYIYRVSMENKITKAGFFNLKDESSAKIQITFGENEDPKMRVDYDTDTSIGSRLEDSILLNINSQNYLRMSTGEEFKARAWRAVQIVNNDASNIMIEPDFHYNIISGDSVTIEGQGQNAVIRGVKPGVSLIEVTYDAIEIGGNTSYTGIYGAIDPDRTGLFAVNVDGNTDTSITLPEWDSDFDTVYFLGETGSYNFAPSSDKPMIVECNSAPVNANQDGTYTLPIKQGNNIVTVTAGDTTEYVIIKGTKLTAYIENAENPGQQIKQGDTVQVYFEGLHIPVPKFSGIYNPGYGSTMKMVYDSSLGGKVSGKGAQYNFINNHTLTFKVYDEGTVNLTGGRIALTCMGDPFGSHRYITDEGRNANFNASEISGVFSILPDISFEVLRNDDISYMYDAYDSYCNLSKVNILCGNSNFVKSFGISKTTESAASTPNANTTFTSINPAYPFTVTAESVNPGVSMEFRYWEEGESEKHSYPLVSGETLNLGTDIFSGENAINMEIIVTPNDPIYSEAKTYSYVAYKNTADFSKPILKTIEINDDSNNAFEGMYGALRRGGEQGISYTDTDYYCYLPKSAQSVTVNAARLVGTSDITVNGETLSVSTGITAFAPITLSGDNDLIEISVADGRTYRIEIIKTDSVIAADPVFGGGAARITLLSPIDKKLNTFVGSYDGITLKDLAVSSSDIVKGDNVIYTDCRYFTNTDNISIMVWDDDMQQYTDKIILAQ